MKFNQKPFYVTIALTILTSLMLLPVSAQETPARQNAPRPAVRRQRIISPEVLPDGRVTFRLMAPKATEVVLTGEWMTGAGASQVMAKSDSGVFSATVGPLKPELYSYAFTVDGVRIIDPINVQVRRDGVNYQSFFIIPGAESDLYFQKNEVLHGTVSKMWYPSAVLGMQRRMFVYTPAGYENTRTKYPVLYLLHGSGGDEDAWTNMGREAQILDNLIAQGKAKPMIVVMTNGNANQYASLNDVTPVTLQPTQGTPNARPTGRFEDHLVKDVVPFIESHYRTYKDKNNRAIAGLSMGGGHTQTITFNNPGMFNYIGVFSMGIMNMGGGGQNVDTAMIRKDRDNKIEALKKSGYKLYWIGVGKDDFLYQTVVTMRNLYDKHNFKYIYRESTGGHTWANWRIYLSEFAPLLFK